MARQTDSRDAQQPLPAGIGRFSLVAGGVILIASLGLGFLGGSLRPRSSEVVFVKTSEVMSRYKAAIKGRETFQNETAAWAEESKQIERKLQELAQTAKPKDDKAIEQVRQMRSRLQALREKGAQRDQELTAPVVAEVNAGIKKFAQKNGYKLVIGTLQGGVVLHGDESVDVTEALIADLNK